jgi:hypothetical protein
MAPGINYAGGNLAKEKPMKYTLNSSDVSALIHTMNDLQLLQFRIYKILFRLSGQNTPSEAKEEDNKSEELVKQYFIKEWGCSPVVSILPPKGDSNA